MASFKGTNAASLAGTGATIGTAIAPGVGTAIGAGVGLLAGGIMDLFAMGDEDDATALQRDENRRINNLTMENEQKNRDASASNTRMQIAGSAAQNQANIDQRNVELKAGTEENNRARSWDNYWKARTMDGVMKAKEAAGRYNISNQLAVAAGKPQVNFAGA